MMTTPTRCRVLVRNVGKLSYSKGLALQRSLVTQYKKEQQECNPRLAGELILCEHDPVFTFGLRQTDFLPEASHLETLGCDVHKVRRGGLTTFHGPGQLVCYPVLNLRKLKVGVRDYVRSLETAVISTLLRYGTKGFTSENTGVWVSHPLKGESKICTIGIQVSHGVAFHGLALNCSTDLTWFDHITPCGVEGKAVTSLTELCTRTVSPNQVGTHLVQELASVLGFETECSMQLY